MKKKAQYMAIDEWPDGNDNLKKKTKTNTNYYYHWLYFC